MKNYFDGITNLNELKDAYRKLSKMYHPDINPNADPEIMKQINAQHDSLFEVLKARQNAAADADETGKTKHTTETPEEFRTIVIELLKLSGLDIELCGSWLWITGNTREHKERLKALGLKWSQNKTAWYWHHPEDGYKRYGKRNYSMDHIRSRYGSAYLTGVNAENAPVVA